MKFRTLLNPSCEKEGTCRTSILPPRLYYINVKSQEVNEKTEVFVVWLTPDFAAAIYGKFWVKGAGVS